MPADTLPGYGGRGPIGRRAHRPPPLLLAAAAAAALLLVLLAFLMNRYSLEGALAVGLLLALCLLCLVRIKWVIYVLIFACLFSPELPIGPVLGRAAKRPVTLRIEDGLLLVLVLAWLARAAVHKNVGLTLRTPLNRPIVFYVLACILATAIGIAIGWVDERLAAILFVAKYIQYFVLFFVMVNYLESVQDIRIMLFAAALTFFAVCLYGLLQIPGGYRPTAFAEYHSEPNTLAGYILLMVGICSGLLLSVRGTRERVVWGVLTALGLVLLAYTLSRSGWAGLLGLLAVLVCLGRHRYAVLATVITVVAALALLSFEVDWLPRPIKIRVDETRGIYEPWPGMPEPATVLGMELDPSATERYRSYQYALTTWADRATEHWVPILTGSGVLGGRPFVDGQYVRVLVETGLLGLVAFLTLLVAIWRTVWASYKELRVPWHRGLALGYLAGFAGLLVHALGANTFIIVRIMEPFFILTAVVVLLRDFERQELGSPPAQPAT